MTAEWLSLISVSHEEETGAGAKRVQILYALKPSSESYFQNKFL